MAARLLDASELCRRCDPSRFAFETTVSLEPLGERVGQERAVEAFRFGVAIKHDGYNLFAMGPSGSGKLTAVRAMLSDRAAQESVPDDICYVHDFQNPQKPRALRLSPGTGRRLRDDVKQLVEELRQVIPGTLEGEEFRARKQHIEEEAKQRHNREFSALREKAAKKGVALLHTPFGFALAPTKGGEVVEPEIFARLPEEERARFKEDIEALSADLSALIEQAPRWEAELRKKLKDLVRETVKSAVGHLLDDLRSKYEAYPQVTEYLAALGQDVLENTGDFIKPDDAPQIPGLGDDSVSPFRRYAVNVLVDNSETKGAPVVYTDHPVYDRLVGRVEHLSRLGALVTDHTLIKPGVLHQANGGYLLVDARNLVLHSFAWDGLKRALLNKEIRVESLSQLLALGSTVSLEPEPVPLSVKVVLLGERLLYYLMAQADPDFAALFKVEVDFEDDVARTPENDLAYARLVATIARDEGLSPFDKGAVARVIERCARLADDSKKLSAHMGAILDLVREADHLAKERGAGVVSGDDVERAVAAQERRSGRIRERVLEQIERGTLFIETDGKKVGQINGLSVMSLGRASFGRPSRITARVRLGGGKVVDIEREVELGGPLHSKGVLILSSFLGSRYAEEHPLALSATLAFEQSYGMVDGDSASSAELYALLSALSGAAIDQGVAVTGSVNQHGEVQPIGGVNEKIEGFFDVCKARGLTGKQGVMIPAANVDHLMLRADVVEAAREGKFHIWSVTTIDEGIAHLTGIPAGERGEDGKFPEGSINARVEARLVALAKLRSAEGEKKDAAKPAEGAT
jgi:lon-related putative ATP-dependent protease